jgi:hypothetical protein
MPEETRTKCRCGLPMQPTQGGGRRCENCDTVQSQEPFGIARRKTAQDIRFEMSWLRTINKEYKDNTKKKKPEVGTTNSPTGEVESPPENEGETHDDQ